MSKEIRNSIFNLPEGGSSGSNWTQQNMTDNAPTLLSAVLYSDNQIDLSWTNNGSGYTGHKIYLSKDNVTFYLRATIKSIGITYRVNDLTVGQIYYFKVVSYKGLNISDYSNTVNTTSDQWYLQSGLALEDCVAVYEPLKARNLTEAKINVINPGTNDLSGGVSPTFDNDKGLLFDGATQYFRTGIVPSANWTAIVKILDSVDPVGGNLTPFGSYNAAGKAFLIMTWVGASDEIQYGNGGKKIVAGHVGSGVVAIAGNKAYRNGIVESGDNIASDTMPEWEIYLGCLNYNNGTKIQWFAGKICLFAVYNKILSAEQILAVTNRMNTVSRGGVWEDHGVVISPNAGQENTTLESNVIYEVGAKVLNTTENVFKIWHTGGWVNKDIYYLESLDGLTWTPYDSNPVITDRARSCVVKIGNIYYLYCANAADSGLDLFTSPNGLVWTLDTENVLVLGAVETWDSTGMSNTFCIIKDGVWYLFYDAYKTGGTTWKTGVATSNDGRIFTKYTGNPILGVTKEISGPWVIKIGSKYYFWGHGENTTSGLPSDMDERYVSTDLLTWTKDTTKSIYVRTTIGEGVNTLIGQVADPCLVEVNNKTYMFYTASEDGTNSTGNMCIKLAIADMPLSQLVLTEEGNKL